jgi:hypothetical protein
MSLAPIKLKKYYLKKLEFKTNMDLDLDVEAKDFNDDGFQFMHHADRVGRKKREWFVVLGVRLQPDGNGEKDCPYHYLLELVGYFEVHPKFPPNPDKSLSPKEVDKKIEDRVKLNGPTVLYGIAREMIRSISASSFSGPIILRTVSFSPPAGTTAKPKAGSKKAKKASPKPKPATRKKPRGKKKES